MDPNGYLRFRGIDVPASQIHLERHPALWGRPSDKDAHQNEGSVILPANPIQSDRITL
jgi:hypothetical protein